MFGNAWTPMDWPSPHWVRPSAANDLSAKGLSPRVTPLHAAPPLGIVPAVPESDTLRYGAYLVTIGHCMECHTPMVRGRHDWAKDLGRGGFEFPGPWGVSVSRNITQSKSKGIGGWSDAEIKRAITTGVDKDGKHLKPPMGFSYYAQMSDLDIADIIAYLRTVPAKE